MKKNNYSNMSAIAVNKSLLKEYQTTHGRTVYLDKDSEFQIKLFNPTTDTIAAEVYVNDKVIGVPIIIRPGQLIWLERYLDEAMRSNCKIVRIIHGKGTGVLRASVHQVLKKNRFIKKYRLGVYGEGEDGVTIAEFA